MVRSRKSETKAAVLDRLGSGRAMNVGFVGEIVGAEDDQIRFGKADARGNLRAHDDGDAQVAGQVAGLVEHGFAGGMRGAAAQPIGNLVLAHHGGHALHIALRGHGENDALLRGHEVAQLLGERRNGAVKAQRGSRVELDLAQRVVFIKHIDGAELIEVEARVRCEQRLQNLRAQINVFGPDERADAAALVALLDLVPPAIDLVAHHGGLVDKQHALGQQLEQMALCASDAAEKLPAGKNADAAGSRHLGGHLFVFAVLRPRRAGG